MAYVEWEHLTQRRRSSGFPLRLDQLPPNPARLSNLNPPCQFMRIRFISARLRIFRPPQPLTPPGLISRWVENRPTPPWRRAVVRRLAFRSVSLQHRPDSLGKTRRHISPSPPAARRPEGRPRSELLFCCLPFSVPFLHLPGSKCRCQRSSNRGHRHPTYFGWDTFPPATATIIQPCRCYPRPRIMCASDGENLPEAVSQDQKIQTLTASYPLYPASVFLDRLDIVHQLEHPRPDPQFVYLIGSIFGHR